MLYMPGNDKVIQVRITADTVTVYRVDVLFLRGVYAGYTAMAETVRHKRDKVAPDLSLIQLVRMTNLSLELLKASYYYHNI